MFKFLVLVLICFSSAHATEFVDEVSLFVVGDVTYTESLLNSLAMIFASDAFSDMSIVAAALFILFTGISASQNQSLNLTLKDGMKFGAIGLLVLNTNMTMTVKIFDKRADYGMVNYVDYEGNAIPSFSAVDNVPWIIGFVAGTASYMSTSLISIIDTAFSPINDQTYAKVGFLATTRSLLDMAKHANFGDDPETQEFENKLTTYLRECVLTHVAPADPSVVLKLKNPESSDMVSQASPTTMGVPSDATLVYGSLGEQTCSNFYDTQIAAKAPTISAKLMKKLNELERPLKSDNLYTAYADLANIKTTSNVLSGVSNLEGFMFNLASRAPLKKAIASYQTGLNISAVDDVNTMASSNANLSLMQAGAGMFEWFAQRLPDFLHFTLGVIYMVGIFPLLASMVMRTFFYIGNYVKLLLGLEFVNVLFAVVHNAVTFYSQHDAFNKFAFLSQAANAGSIENAPLYLEHLSTMTGIAGSLGIVLALALPSALLKGDISSILGGIGAIVTKYSNRLSDIGSTLEQQLANDKLNEERMREGQSSVSAGEMLQAQKIKASMDRAAQAYASVIASSNDSSYMHGSSVSATNQVANTIGTGNSGVTNAQSFRSGELMGQSSGGVMQEMANSGLSSAEAKDSGRLEGGSRAATMIANAEMTNSAGFEHFLRGVGGETSKRLGQTAGAGKEMEALGMNFADMREMGSYGGAEALGSEFASLTGKKAAHQFNSDGTLSETAMKGAERGARVSAERLMGIGGTKDPSQSDWNAIRTQSGGQFNEQFAGAKGYIKSGAVDSGGNLNSDYATGIQNQADIKASQIMGAGSNGALSAEQRTLMNQQASGQYQEQFSSAQGYVDESMNGNKLKDGYAKGVQDMSAKKAATTTSYGEKTDPIIAALAGKEEGLEMAGKDLGKVVELNEKGDQAILSGSTTNARSGVANITGLSKLNSTDTNNFIDATESKSEWGAKQTIGDVAGTKQAVQQFGKNNESVGDTLERMAQVGAKARVGSTLASMNQVGDEAYANNQILKAQGDTAALDTTIKETSKYQNDTGSGYLAFQQDSAALNAQSKVGNLEGLRDVISSPQKLQSAVNQSLATAKKESIARYNAVKKDFTKAGLIDEHGNVNADNWIKSKAYLNANNMNAMNALVAGGMMFSINLGDESSVQASSMNSLAHGHRENQSENSKIVEKGEQTSFDPISNIVGTGGASDVIKTGVAAVGVVGAADLATGGRVHRAMKERIDNFMDKGHIDAGHVKGKDGKFYDPMSEADRISFFRNNPDHSNLSSHDVPVHKPTPKETPLSKSSVVDEIAEVGAKMEHGGNKVTKTLGAAMVGLAGMSLFSSDAEAKTLSDIKPNAAASALTPVDTKGFSEIAGDGVDKAWGGLMAVEGAAMLGAKTASKIAPGLGMAVGAADAAYRTSQGDYMGAALSGAIAGASTIPGVGTAAAIGLSLVQAGTDYFGITGQREKTPIQAPTESSSLQTSPQHQSNLEKLKEGIDMDGLLKEQGPTPDVIMREHGEILRENANKVEEMLEGQTELERQIEKLKRQKRG